MDPKSKIEDYSHEELLDGLAFLKAKYPSVHKWFIVWELEKLHGARRSGPGLDQEQEANSGQA